MADKTIGVVTLPSKETQSLRIKDAIDQAITHPEYLHHKILVGPPARFQGSERDIMFVAMTWDGNSGGASDKPEFHQRFNVAMSRARDQMILVRSIPDTGLRGGTLMAQVARHFHDAPHDTRGGEHGRQRCNSDLERAMFDALAARGVAVFLDSLPDTLVRIALDNTGLAQVQRHAQAAIEGLDGGDGVLGARFGQSEDVAPQLLQLDALGLDQFAQ